MTVGIAILFTVNNIDRARELYIHLWLYISKQVFTLQTFGQVYAVKEEEEEEWQE